MGLNRFSDMTEEEFVSLFLGDNGPQPSKIEMEKLGREEENNGYLGDIDWRNSKIVTDVKDQGRCGSCWAFAATAAHESYQIQFKGQPRTIDLSEQMLVDCAFKDPYNNNGCNGGYAIRALEYIKDHGQVTGDKYPYKAETMTCLMEEGNYRIAGVAESTGCSEIEQIIQRRPLAVRVDATNWKNYASGIFDACEANLNHAVFMVGSFQDSWLIKNSWSEKWGESGYIKLKKGNTCGVCFGPSFPI